MTLPFPVKPRPCKGCGKDFTPRNTMQVVCGVRCAKRKVKADKKAEKQLFKERKAATVSTSKLEDQCRAIVQKIARIRDRNYGCISCDKPANWNGQWHGSHFRSHGACSALQFHLWNINRACWICNKIFSGRIDQYELGLIARYGQERVDWLNAQPNPVIKSTPQYREYLVRFKKVMGKRARRMEKWT